MVINLGVHSAVVKFMLFCTCIGTKGLLLAVLCRLIPMVELLILCMSFLRQHVAFSTLVH